MPFFCGSRGDKPYRGVCYVRAHFAGVLCTRIEWPDGCYVCILELAWVGFGLIRVLGDFSSAGISLL